MAVPFECLQKLPKAELHRHLDGSVRVSSVVELAREMARSQRQANAAAEGGAAEKQHLGSDQPHNTSLDHPLRELARAVLNEATKQGKQGDYKLTEDEVEAASLEALDEIVTEEALIPLICVDGECESLEQYLRGFTLTLLVLQSEMNLTRIMYEVCEDAVKDNVRYLEVRFSPVLHTNAGLSLASIMEAVLQGQKLAQYHLNINVNLIVCGMRHLSPDVTLSLAEIAWRFKDKGVAGFDLAGPEDGFSSRHHKAAFDLIRSKLLNCTIHSGEAYGPDSIKDSIRFCGAHRLGHGTRLFEDPQLQEFVADHGIVLECCLTSNVQTKAVKTLEGHPIRQYFDSGVIVVPCCDNTTVSNVTLSGEYDLLQKIPSLHFTPVEILKLIDNGFKSAFMESSERQRMRAEAILQSVRVMCEYGVDLSPLFESTGIARQNFEVWLDAIGIAFDQLDPRIPDATHPIRALGPQLTLSDIAALPKADLHVRLDGSISIAQLWEEFRLAKVDVKHLFGNDAPSNAADFAKFVRRIAMGEDTTGVENTPRPGAGLLRSFSPEHRSPYNKKLLQKVKDLFHDMLQTEDQLNRAVQDIFKQALADNVFYLELVVRPIAHTKKTLSEFDVVSVVLKAIAEQETVCDHKIKCGLVLMVSSKSDDPVDFRRIAELAVDSTLRERGVCGFGVYGSFELTEIEHYRSTFTFLKRHSVKVSVFAGKDNTESVLDALHVGGAARLSGCFAIHRYPRLMSYLAEHKIPVELCVSRKLARYTGEVQPFAGHILRLYLDAGLRVALCSMRAAFDPFSRNELLFDIVKSCQLSGADLLKLLQLGFMQNFQGLKDRERMWCLHRQTAIDVLVARGFKEHELCHRSFVRPLPV